MGVYVCVWLNKTNTLYSSIFIFEPFKSSYVSFHFWMEVV